MYTMHYPCGRVVEEKCTALSPARIRFIVRGVYDFAPVADRPGKVFVFNREAWFHPHLPFNSHASALFDYTLHGVVIECNRSCVTADAVRLARDPCLWRMFAPPYSS